jgi:hypothetical protein
VTRDYPKRPKFFAYRFCRVMAKVCLANEIGPEVCWLLTVIAHTEDAKGYRDAVTFFNAQLMALAGCGSVDALTRARTKAIEAGWLRYEPGGRRKAGRYWVIIPDQHRDWDDAPSDEWEGKYDPDHSDSTDPSSAPERIKVRNIRTRADQSADESADQSAEYPHQSGSKCGPNSGISAPERIKVRIEAEGKCGLKPRESADPSSLTLTLTQRQTDRQTDRVGPSASPDHLEPFDPLKAEQAARKLFESRWNAAGLRPFSRLTHTLHSRLVSLLGDAWWAENYPAALERAGKIPWLAAGLGRQKGAYDVGEFLRDPDECRKILDGVYDQHLPVTTSAGGAAAIAPREAQIQAAIARDRQRRAASSEGKP